MKREDIVRKIKACLELGNSSNEHEAKIALNQAMILMKKYDITEEYLDFHSLNNAEVKVNTSIRKKWFSVLLASIHQVFGVTSVKRGKKIVFYGHDLKPELAQYAFDSLYSKVIFLRKEYIQKNLKRYKKVNKTYLADQYALGITNSLWKTIFNFKSSYEFDKRKEEIRMIDEIIASELNIRKVGHMQSKASKSVREKEYRVYIDGVKDSDDIDLFQPLKDNEKNRLTKAS